MQATLEAPPHAKKSARKEASRRGFRRARARLSTLRDLARHFSGTGRWWLMPMVAIFLVAAGLLVVIGIIEYAAPFVYTLF